MGRRERNKEIGSINMDENWKLSDQSTLQPDWLVATALIQPQQRVYCRQWQAMN
jgi:hypothetical protein